jgi:hypothetical protein
LVIDITGVPRRALELKVRGKGPMGQPSWVVEDISKREEKRWQEVKRGRSWEDSRLFFY